MKETLLIETVYGPIWQELISYFRFKLKKLLSELEVSIETIEITDSGNIYIKLTGPDEEFAINLINKQYHPCRDVQSLNLNTPYFGKFVQVGKFGYGLYTSIGARHNNQLHDALIPLYTLRSQLAYNKKIAARKLIDLYGFVNNMPVEVVLNKINLDSVKLEAGFSGKEISRFKKWTDDGLDRINICGILKRKITGVLQDTNHEKDITHIEQLGIFEFSLVCKEGTNAPGIISKIGPKLPGIEMNAFIPKKIVNQLK